MELYVTNNYYLIIDGQAKNKGEYYIIKSSGYIDVLNDNHPNGLIGTNKIISHICRNELAKPLEILEIKLTVEDLQKTFHLGRVYSNREGDTTFNQYIARLMLIKTETYLNM